MPVNRSILQPKWVFKKALSFSADKIEGLLFEIKEGDFTNATSPFLVLGTGEGNIVKEEDRYVLNYTDKHRVFLYVNRSKHYIAIKGEWWYCGVYSVAAEKEGATLMLEVFNVAPRFRWAAGLMELTRKKKHRTGFNKLVLMLEEECSK